MSTPWEISAKCNVLQKCSTLAARFELERLQTSGGDESLVCADALSERVS
jgi:hypothetical protein